MAVVATVIALLVVAVPTVWAGGAIYFDLLRGRGAAAAVAFWAWVLACVAAVIVLGPVVGTALVVLACGGVYLWWRTLPPSLSRAWKPEYSVQATGTLDGDWVTIRGVRNGRFGGDRPDVAFEDRRYRLSSLRGAEVLLSYWATPLLCHPVMIFDFGDGAEVLGPHRASASDERALGRVAWSVEARHAEGGDLRLLHSVYRAQELVALALDERDVLSKRLEIETPSRVYVYRLRLSPATLRRLFLQFVEIANGLAQRPRWYNALTTNCITAVYTHSDLRRLPIDYRLVVSGKLDAYLHERGIIESAGGFEALRRASLVNEMLDRETPLDGWWDVVRNRREDIAARAARTVDNA